MVVEKNKELPRLISDEFLDINRYWDHVNKTHAAKIAPGEYYVSGTGELITTVLGSCIAACVRDVRLGIGGMNHFMLPSVNSYSGDWNKKLLSVAGRYGNLAMEKLINCILANGGKRSQLEFKIFGGARVLDIDSEVGTKNIMFITEYLRAENFTVEAYDLGGPNPRKVNYFPDSGVVMMKKLGRLNGQTLQLREREYYNELGQQAIESDVTVFFND